MKGAVVNFKDFKSWPVRQKIEWLSAKIEDHLPEMREKRWEGDSLRYLRQGVEVGKVDYQRGPLSSYIRTIFYGDNFRDYPFPSAIFYTDVCICFGDFGTFGFDDEGQINFCNGDVSDEESRDSEFLERLAGHAWSVGILVYMKRGFVTWDNRSPFDVILTPKNVDASLYSRYVSDMIDRGYIPAMSNPINFI